MDSWGDPVPKPNNGREKEIRKVKSRHAAQSRRILENEEFDHLASVLPVPRAISTHLLDKASVIRLTISFLKLNKFCADGCPSWTTANTNNEDDFYNYYNNHHQCSKMYNNCQFEENIGTRILEAIDGFLFCISDEGILLYVSETVSIGLGLSQIELIGNHFVDYLHVDDAVLFNQMLDESRKLNSQFYQKSFSARIKSSLVKRATKDTYESAVGFKAVEIHMAPRLHNTADGWPICVGFSGLAAPLPSTTMPECRLDNWTFVISTLLDFKLQYIDTRGEEVLGFSAENLSKTAVSFYSIVYVDDVLNIGNFHKEILRLGSSCSHYFRVIQSNGFFLWMQAYGIRVNRPRARQNQNLITLLCHIIG